jgi:DNA-binding response OmpR family regulator
LEVLKDNTTDLIILDMNMPIIGVLEFYQRICFNDRPKYPILVLTARANMEQLFHEFNVDGFMAKPFEFTDLLKKVEIIINSKSDEIKYSGDKTNDNRPMNVCIVENDPERLIEIGSFFLKKGFW